MSETVYPNYEADEIAAMYDSRIGTNRLTTHFYPLLGLGITAVGIGYTIAAYYEAISTKLTARLN